MKNLVMIFLSLFTGAALAQQSAQGFANTCGLEQAKRAIGNNFCSNRVQIFSRIGFDASSCLSDALLSTDTNLYSSLSAQNSYDISVIMGHVQSELQSYISRECGSDREVSVEPNADGQSLRVEIRMQQAQDESIKPEVFAALKDAPGSVQHHALRLIKDSCDGEGGAGESPVLVGMPAHDRAKMLNIELEDAIDLNTFLLNHASDPCSQTLALPAIQQFDEELPTLPSLETI
ncbi:MAG: hypothetical protein HRT45_01695 [Bdellovibrionales bacterium]|nr:hypothetical protein [Bdellovibrionales bacterium]